MPKFIVFTQAAVCDTDRRDGIQNDGFCVENDEFWIKNDEFSFKMMNFAGLDIHRVCIGSAPSDRFHQCSDLH